MDPLAAALLAALTATWSALTAAFFRGDLIPGHVYRREVNRGDTATIQNERNVKAIETLTTAGKADSLIIRDLQATLKLAVEEIAKLKADA